MRVLVAYDGTMDSKAALRYGVRKVRKHGGELIAFHVFRNGLFVDYDGGLWAEEAARRESTLHVEGIRTLLRQIGGDIRSQIVVAEGVPEDEILQYVKKEDIDLVVSPPVPDRVIRNCCCLLDVVTA